MALIEIEGGARLDVATFGDEAAPPLLMVCATSISYGLWAGMAQGFADSGYYAICYNHRGMGESPRPDHPLSMRDMADDAAALLDALEIDRAHVFGWSLGTAVSQELAINHPAKVASLVLWGTWDHVDPFQGAVLAGLNSAWTLGMQQGDMTPGFAAFGLAFSPELVNSEDFGTMFAELAPTFPQTPGQILTTSEQWDADLKHDTRGRLESISAPTLVVAGEQDLLTPVNRCQAVADAIPGARIEILTGPGSSHALGIERATEFAPLVLGFLGEHPLEPAAT